MRVYICFITARHLVHKIQEFETCRLLETSLWLCVVFFFAVVREREDMVTFFFSLSRF